MASVPPATHSPAASSFAQTLAFWLKLGFISFGGPAGQIAVMHQEPVERRRWISERRFLHALNYCVLLPRPEAQQLATYIGWLLHGTRGGIVAGGLFVLPSLFILMALSWVYLTFGNVPAVAGLIYGIKPAVTAIVLFAAYRSDSRALRNAALWAIAAVAFVAIFAFRVPFPYIVLGAGILGVVGLALVIVPMAALAWADRWTAALTRMGWFFTWAALPTFGGAYVVLPYVYQAAVETYGWLTPAQVIDGLALGETTPGPLIMIVAFVGFAGSWSHAALGPGRVLAAGVAGATIATYFTFLPSFLFILVGARWSRQRTAT